MYWLQCSWSGKPRDVALELGLFQKVMLMNSGRWQEEIIKENEKWWQNIRLAGSFLTISGGPGDEEIQRLCQPQGFG